jgi:hypothetical protein
MDVTLLSHIRGQERRGTDYFRYEEERRFHNEKNCPYPLPNDLSEIDR